MDAKVTEEELSRLAYEECLTWLESGDGQDEPVEQAFGEGAMAAWLHQSRKLAERDAQIAEMQKVTGPKCPKCGHWLKARHEKRWWGPANDPSVTTGSAAFECKTCSSHPEHSICFTVPELIANHPEIAAELGLTEGNDGK